jgi:hypothetical protein
MPVFKQGDRVIVSGRVDWPSPPGYRFTGAEGTVEAWVHYTQALEGFSEFVFVRLDRVEGQGAEYAGGSFFFRADDLTKIVLASEVGLWSSAS